MSRRALAIALVVLLAAAIPICAGDDSDAEAALLHFDYLPVGQAWIPATIGEAPDPVDVQTMVDKGTWHYEADGTPWSPEDIVTADRLNIIIDERPPEPVPPVPPPEPTPTPVPPSPPAPTPTPSGSSDSTDLRPWIIGGAISAGAVVLIGVLLWSSRRL